MKKFTVISLVLVLVAGFAFAAGLVPYNKSVAGVTFSGSSEYDEEREKWVSNLDQIEFNGSFTFGAKDASGKVDVNIKNDLTFTDNPDGLDDCGVFTPSLNFIYKGTNLYGNVKAIYEVEKNGPQIFGMDVKHYTKTTDEFTFSADATYANELKNSENIVKVFGKETVVFYQNKLVEPTTEVAVAYYVPFEGTDSADVLKGALYEEHQFMAQANGKVSFNINNGAFDKNTLVQDLSLAADYNRYINGYENSLNFNGFVGSTTKYVGEEKTSTVKANIEGNYHYEAVKGFNGLDVFAFDAKAGFSTSYKKGAADKATVFSAEATLQIPRLIPVELIDCASLNIPMIFDAQYSYDKNDQITAQFEATAYPVYVEFNNGAKVFGKYINNLAMAVSYGNAAFFDFGGEETGAADKSNHMYFFGIGAELGLGEIQGDQLNSKVPTTISLTYARNEIDNFNSKLYDAEPGLGVVTLSYSTKY